MAIWTSVKPVDGPLHFVARPARLGPDITPASCGRGPGRIESGDRTKGAIMKILLILPAAEHLRVTRQHRAVPRRKMLRFSVLPLSVVAALTPKSHPVEIRDENCEPIDFDAPVDVVGISFMTALAPRA
jgi:hypothetical protein